MIAQNEQGGHARGKEEVRKESGNDHPFPQGTQVLANLSHMRDARSTRRALGLSLSQLGERLSQVHPNGHGRKPYAKQTVSMWEHRGTRKKYRMTEPTRQAYAAIVSQVVTQETAGRVWVRAHLGSRVWKFEAIASCGECGKPFRLQRSNQKRCTRCIAYKK